MKTIAGIGSRCPQRKILAGVNAIAQELCYSNYDLRTGGAQGCDSEFEAGYRLMRDNLDMCDVGPLGSCTVFVPWYGFNRRTKGVVNIQTLPKYGMAMELAEQIHPAWDRCSRGARALHARNCFVLLGRELNSPVDAVICWTPGGHAAGGTGQSIRMARHFGIPVFNLHNAKTMAMGLHELSPYFQCYVNETDQWDDMYAGRV
jgi:hypothetical protein